MQEVRTAAAKAKAAAAVLALDPNGAGAARPASEPRVMLAGAPEGLRRRAVSSAAGVVLRPRAEEVPRLIATDPPDVILLDASLPAELLAPILLALGPAKGSRSVSGLPDAEGPRPAVLVFLPEGRRPRLEKRLREHADD